MGRSNPEKGPLKESFFWKYGGLIEGGGAKRHHLNKFGAKDDDKNGVGGDGFWCAA